MEHSHAALVPELMVSDFDRSLDFYTGLLGFTRLYGREDPAFAYLDREGAQIMIERTHDDPAWLTGPLEAPCGRGINFQIEVSDIEALAARLTGAGWSFRLALEDAWYATSETREVGNRQFMIQDPDGYLLRFFEDLGERVIGDG